MRQAARRDLKVNCERGLFAAKRQDVWQFGKACWLRNLDHGELAEIAKDAATSVSRQVVNCQASKDEHNARLATAEAESITNHGRSRAPAGLSPSANLP